MPNDKIVHNDNHSLDSQQKQDKKALIEKFDIEINKTESFYVRLKLRIKKYLLVLNISTFQNLY